jgi:hypothetical protein
MLFLCFRKVTQEIFLELDEMKSQSSYLPDTKTKSKGETESSQEAAAP